MAKTQYSLSDDATKLGRPSGYRLTVRDAYVSAGAGFVVALAGDIHDHARSVQDTAPKRSGCIPTAPSKDSSDMELVSTTGAPKAIGPYSQGIIAGGLVFTAGQVAIDRRPAT